MKQSDLIVYDGISTIGSDIMTHFFTGHIDLDIKQYIGEQILPIDVILDDELWLELGSELKLTN